MKNTANRERRKRKREVQASGPSGLELARSRNLDRLFIV
jgi:hypothetical protein